MLDLFELFYLEVKGQGPTKVIMVRNTLPYGHAHTNYLPMKFCWIYLNYFTLRSKVKVPQRSLWYTAHRFMVMHPHTRYHWPISKDKNVMAQTRKYYFKKNYLTLRSKVKVPQRSLQYVIHRLMVMHPHTKYNWAIWKDKKVMVRTSFAEKKRKRKKKWKQ